MQSSKNTHMRVLSFPTLLVLSETIPHSLCNNNTSIKYDTLQSNSLLSCSKGMVNTLRTADGKRHTVDKVWHYWTRSTTKREREREQPDFNINNVLLASMPSLSRPSYSITPKREREAVQMQMFAAFCHI